MDLLPFHVLDLRPCEKHTQLFLKCMQDKRVHSSASCIYGQMYVAIPATKKQKCPAALEGTEMAPLATLHLPNARSRRPHAAARTPALACMLLLTGSCQLPGISTKAEAAGL